MIIFYGLFPYYVWSVSGFYYALIVCLPFLFAGFGEILHRDVMIGGRIRDICKILLVWAILSVVLMLVGAFVLIFGLVMISVQ